jgi:hypothetical protein
MYIKIENVICIQQQHLIKIARQYLHYSFLYPHGLNIHIFMLITEVETICIKLPIT